MQVKRDVATVTDIPVFRQSWSGWPEDCNDDLSLLQVGLQSEAVLRVNLVRRHDKQDNTEVGDSYVILDMMCDITLTDKCGKLIDFPRKKFLLMNAVYVLHIFCYTRFTYFLVAHSASLLVFWCFPIQ